MKIFSLALAAAYLGLSQAVTLDSEAPLVNTLSEARLMNKVFKGDVRVEEVNGTYAMIEHSNTKHIGTVSGDALTYLLDASDKIEKRQNPPCSHNACALVTQCAQGCAFCYPVVCI